MHGWKKYLGTRDFYATVFKIAIPISLQSLITVGVNLMDTVMLSSMGDAQFRLFTQEFIDQHNTCHCHHQQQYSHFQRHSFASFL